MPFPYGFFYEIVHLYLSSLKIEYCVYTFFLL